MDMPLIWVQRQGEFPKIRNIAAGLPGTCLA
jgi:hypothetical protein